MTEHIDAVGELRVIKRTVQLVLERLALLEQSHQGHVGDISRIADRQTVASMTLEAIDKKIGKLVDLLSAQ